MFVRKFDVESVLPDIHEAQCLHFALTFLVVSQEEFQNGLKLVQPDAVQPFQIEQNECIDFKGKKLRAISH